jgi:hypothetical protein
MSTHRIFAMPFAKVYPLYVQKADRKGRTQEAVASMNEAYPLERAAEGFERMLSGKARFRVVLTMGG